MKKKLHVGQNPIFEDGNSVHGQQDSMGGEDFYCIANYNRMRPFLMSIVSGSDHWMFISSNGALTAGRGSPDLALFPYYTDDKIHDSAEITGSKTVMTICRQGRDYLWEPFSDRYTGIYRIERNLYKNFTGNKLIFEETNLDLGLTFCYGWFNSDQFGFVRKAWLTNSGTVALRINLLDGIQNLMPCGIGSQFQLEKSTLIDAYKKNELVEATGLGLFALSAIPVDRPEPAEALKTTAVWSIGLPRRATLLSSVQLDHFRRGQAVRTENDVRAERGAYFVNAEISLRHGQSVDWLVVADVNQGPSQIAKINRYLRRPKLLQKLVETDIDRGTADLRKLVASADGFQKSGQSLRNARHFGNALFNIMRGGVFADGYQIDPADLLAFVGHANHEVAASYAAFFRKLGKTTRLSHLLKMACKTGDANLERLCREYLPLTFSRRHGDPSRPWNRFSIATRNADGSRVLNYEGNWRDIFQNWEALAVSFPGFTSGMICRFVNASTADGYNPYRIARDGIDWEIVDPHDPWSHIGYWGDHQIIYLLKLLEVLKSHEPVTLQEFLTRKVFSYANVPYRIKPYEQLLATPKETVDFDPVQNELIGRRVKAKGSDGKLIWGADGQVHLVNLTEKMLVLLLAKISNFVPEAGIWLNTQRPEWNDANNALVGNGASMVTLYHLRRYLVFCLETFRSLEQSEVSISAEVARLFLSLHRVLKCHKPLLAKPLDDRARRRILDDLGRAGCRYRKKIYAGGFSGRMISVKGKRLLDFFNVALAFADESIKANRRPDGLYHAYNLIKLDRDGEIPIRRLYTMLEGQVAVLNSGCLSAEESLGLLMALKRSELFRADQYSYLLYPNRQLPRFVEKNNIPGKEIARSRLLKKLLADGSRLLVEQDVNGRYHFNAAITSARDLHRILEKLSLAGYARLVDDEKTTVLEIFERLFDHQSFTGRSGTFFGYEGLGCIYWHMVSKLLLAVQETFFHALDSGVPQPVLRKLAGSYYDIRSGIGDCKSPGEYGAFPMDPYSHTPAQAGARQPGLTGQVKEDILCRMGELGVFVKKGQIHFRPALLKREEFISRPDQFHYYDLNGSSRCLRLQPGSLAFTHCQVPVVYRLGRKNCLRISFNRKPAILCEELCLDAETSQSIFNRAGMVSRIIVTLNEKNDFFHEESSGLYRTRNL